MGASSTFQNVCRCLCLITVALSACRAANSSYNLAPAGDGAQKQQKGDSLRHLDLRNPTLTQPITAADKLNPACKFVQIEIAKIDNPKRYALQFKLYYLPTNEEKIYLGSFGTYPADNPGKFIVATQGKVKDAGSLMLSMTLIDKAEPEDNVQVALKEMICRPE